MADEEPRYKILEIFGIPLEVSSKKLASILKADVRDALTTEIGSGAASSAKARSSVEETVAAEPEVEAEAIAPDYRPTGFQEFRSRIETIGEALGFHIKTGGLWTSPANFVLLVRYVEVSCNSEKAKKFAVALADQLSKLKDENSGLFVVADQLTCETFRVAIKSKSLYNKVRVITLDNLNELLILKQKMRFSHKEVATLLVPLHNIDVGELLNVLKAANYQGKPPFTF